jgi:diphthamide synthase (EF-2-diphthine--ammonia ligase)
MDKREPVLFCWSGGKDSAIALHALLQDPEVRVVALLTVSKLCETSMLNVF